MKQASIYLAGSYSRRDEFKGYAEQLKALGYNIVSRWLEETHGLDIQPTDLTPDLNRTYAEQDLDDIEQSDIFILFSYDQQTLTKRNGRMVEFGYALANYRNGFQPERIIVCGPKENIFTYLEEVELFPTWEELLSDLSQ